MFIILNLRNQKAVKKKSLQMKIKKVYLQKCQAFGGLDQALKKNR